MTRNRFKIAASFPIKQKNLFVFVGEVIEGKVAPGMIFDVPEAGHFWTLQVLSVETISKSGGGVCLGVVVQDGSPRYLPGLGGGWIAEMFSDG